MPSQRHRKKTLQIVQARRRSAFRAERDRPPPYEWDLGDPRLSRRWDVKTDAEDFERDEDLDRMYHYPRVEDCLPAPGTLAAVWTTALDGLRRHGAQALATRMRGTLPAVGEHFTAPATRTPQALEEAVVAWLDGLHAPESTLQAIRALPQEHAALMRLADQLDRWIHGRHIRDMAVVVLMGFPFWIRPLSTWTGGARPEVLAHLFACYPLPPFLCCAAVRSSEVNEPLHVPADPGSSPHKYIHPLAWLVLRGQGGSVARVARQRGWGLPRTLVHHTEASAPAWTSLAHALLYGEAARLGGGPVELARMLGNGRYHDDAFARDPHALGAMEGSLWTTWTERRRAFWRDTVRWLLRHRAQLTDADARTVLRWADHVESNSGAFPWKRLSAARAVAAARRTLEAWGRTLDTTPRTWAAHGWDWAWNADGGPWELVELTSSGALLEEGATQQHCVGGYAERCVKDLAAIFQLRHAGQRRATIEVEPTTRQIMQARGRFNSALAPEEHAVLVRWRDAVLERQAQSDADAGPLTASCP